MALYALMSMASLGMVAPFMRILFERPAARAGAAAPTAIVTPLTSPTSDRLSGWPKPLLTWAQGTLLDAKPLVALERVCLLVLVALLLKNLADYLQAFLMVSVEQAAIRDLRAALFGHLLRLPLKFFTESRAGGLLSRLTNDFEYLRASL